MYVCMGGRGGECTSAGEYAVCMRELLTAGPRIVHAREAPGPTDGQVTGASERSSGQVAIVRDGKEEEGIGKQVARRVMWVDRL